MLDFQIQYGVTAELVELFRRGLERCNVKPNEVVAVFGDTNTNPLYMAAFMAAAKQLGAGTFQLIVPSMPELVGGGGVETERAAIPRGAFEAMKAADLVVNLATVRWLYTDEHNQILRSGTRTWLVKNPPNVLRRLIPSQEVKERSLAGARILDRGKTVRIKSDAGTDIVFNKSGRPGKAIYGASDTPGRFDHWTAGSVSCAPIEGSAQGVMGFEVGDVMLRIPRYVSQRVRCEFEDGVLTKIDGGLDGVLMRLYLEKFQDPKAFIPAHIGWGTEHRAQWQMLAEEAPGGHHDAEFFYGNVLLGMGANFYDGMGGKNVTKAHMDLCFRNCSVWVDELQVLDHGSFLIEDLK